MSRGLVAQFFGFLVITGVMVAVEFCGMVGATGIYLFFTLS